MPPTSPSAPVSSAARAGILERARVWQAATGGISYWESSRSVADEAVAGRLFFRFFGAQITTVGRAHIDWSGAHHAHQEWPAQLNRFFQLPALAAAFRETNDPRYAEAARDYVADWLRAHPTRLDWTIAPYDNTLNLTIRLQLWWSALPVCFEAAVFDDAGVDALVESSAAQLAYLQTHLSTVGNWRIAQAEGFMVCGLVLAHRPEAEAWRRLAVDMLNDAFHRQVLPDGAHSERNPGYHEWMTAVFTRYWRLGRQRPELGLAMEAETIAHMHDYALATKRPNGAYNSFHDCTGAYTGPRPEKWDAARRAFRLEAGLPDVPPPPCQYFPDAGQACLRSDWNEDAVYVTFDATQWGGGHCHLSRNAVQLHAFGRSLLVDPGVLNYDARDPLMAYGRSTRAHSTLNLNGWNQSPANPSRLRYASLPGYDCVGSRYSNGYWPGRYHWYFDQGFGHGVWSEHQRLVLWVHERCVVVLDRLCRGEEAGPAHPPRSVSLESNWQLAPGQVTVEPERWRAYTRYDDANLLLLFPLRMDGMRLSVHEGEKDPLRGWLAGPTPAPQVNLTWPVMEYRYADLVTVLIPYRGRTPPEVGMTAVPPDRQGLGRVTLTWPDATTDEVIWTPWVEYMIGQQPDIQTDAALVHLQKDGAGRLTRGFVLDGTYAAPFHPARRSAPGAFALYTAS